MDSNALDLAAGSGPIVKGVLVILTIASIASWTVIVMKWLSFKQATNENIKFLEMFWSAPALDKIFTDSKDYSASPVSNVFRSGYVEYQKVSTKGKESGKNISDVGDVALENVQRSLQKATVAELMRLEKFTSLLASTASVAPFIGLFGTVWGIMNSFHSLGLGGPATLQRVAPGISEALIATAVGLAAAIPAVLFYNYYSTRIRSYRVDMENFSSEFCNILKRNYLG